MKMLGVDYRLRLAARTLLEWRTPSSNPDYKRVLSDLLKDHAGAQLHRLAENADVLLLDEDGSLIWFLSETLQNHEKDNWRFHWLATDVVEKELVERCLITLTTAENEWSFPPDVLFGYGNADLRDVIYTGMTSGREDTKRQALLALVALSMPISAELQGPFVAKVTSCVAGMSVRFRRAAMMASKVYDTIIEGLDVVRLLSALGFTVPYQGW